MKITRKAGRQEMNRLQRKKKSKQQEITIFIGCEMVARAEDYRKMKNSIEYQLRAGVLRLSRKAR